MIVPTPNIMNGYNIIDLYKHFITKEYIAHGDIHINLLTEPAHLQLKNLPEHHKKILKQKYIDLIEWISNSGKANILTDINQFNFLISQLEKDRSEEEFKRFLLKTKQVDQYRGNDFYKVFTEYADFIS